MRSSQEESSSHFSDNSVRLNTLYNTIPLPFIEIRVQEVMVQHILPERLHDKTHSAKKSYLSRILAKLVVTP